MNLDLQSITTEVVNLMKNTGEFMREEFEKFDFARIERKSGSNDLVSYVDKESEKRLVEGLLKILPEAGVLGEEGAEKEGAFQDLKWIIDPLDGTTNFTHGLPVFAISIGLAHGKELLVGGVYEVNRKEAFYAWKDGGAWLNGKRIQVSPINDFSDGLYATGFPYHFLNRLDDYMAIFSAIATTTHGLRRLGSAAVDLCYVACGRFQGYYEFNLHPWDVAGGIIIMQEAGGKVTDFDGGTENILTGKEIIAAGPVHDQLRAMINKHW